MTSVLIIGTGSIGERHLRCFQATDRCTTAICEPNEEVRSRVAAAYGCPSFADLGAALSARAWDAAVICAPAHLHIVMAVQCVSKGVHLLIEKPLSTSLDGVPALAGEVKLKGVTVRVAYVHRSMPEVVCAHELVHSGRIGAIKHVVGTAGAHFPTSRPAYAQTYFARRETGGGCIQDALTHTAHTVEWLAGPFEKIYCDASHQVLADVQVEDTVNLTGRLRGGIPVTLSQNQFQAPYEIGVAVHGESGSVCVELHRHRAGLFLHGEGAWAWTSFPKEERDLMFIRQANSFLDAMEGKADHLATFEESVQTLKVNLAALASADTDRPIHLSCSNDLTCVER